MGRILPILSVALVLCSLVAKIEGLEPIHQKAVIGVLRSRPLCKTCLPLVVRGGSVDNQSDSDRGDEELENDTDDDDESGFLTQFLFNKETTSTLMNAGKKTLLFFGNVAMKTISAASRAVAAAFQSNGELTEEDEASPLLAKVARVLQRMMQAAFYSEGSPETDAAAPVRPSKVAFGNKVPSDMPELEEKPTQRKSGFDNTSKAKIRLPDFGNYLSKAYGIEATRDDLDKADQGMPILGGTLSDALRIARSKARLLVVMVPASKPGKSQTADVEAIRSLLSAEVATTAERKARKSGQTSSYAIWGAKAGSPESVAALKRIKATQTNSKGQKRPILSVVYPAQVMGGDGVPKIVPKLLAQHHCSPPPSSEMMAAWLNALRKRHAKQYTNMQVELKEVELHRERTEGYKGSIQSDRERQQRELQEAAELRRKEEAEKERSEAIMQRREELLQSMPAEPPNDDPTAQTIALRLADGRTDQRRFTPETKLSTLFNWVDAKFGLEREITVLTTLNGQRSFEWDASDVALSESGLSRMTALRVTEKKRPQASVDNKVSKS
jgi:hypothetical protein